MPEFFPPLTSGLASLFRIGVRPLGEESRFVPDSQLGAYLSSKELLGRDRFADIFMAEDDTGAAQAETLRLVCDELVLRHPAHYRRVGDRMLIDSVSREVALTGAAPPLWIAAQMVQEDLVIMRKGPDGWRLAAAALCFPSSWKLSEKFGRPMQDVHKTVPDFGPDTRNAMMIERMFDNLRPETPVLRGNWGLYGDAELFHPGNAEPDVQRFGTGERAENVFLRAERQTLSRLPDSGDILFTIRIFVDPIEAVLARADGADVARSIVEHLRELSAEQIAYKGWTAERKRLIEMLENMTGRA